jgi:hypothetical protein
VSSRTRISAAFELAKNLLGKRIVKALRDHRLARQEPQRSFGLWRRVEREPPCRPPRLMRALMRWSSRPPASNARIAPDERKAPPVSGGVFLWPGRWRVPVLLRDGIIFLAPCGHPARLLTCLYGALAGFGGVKSGEPSDDTCAKGSCHANG